MAVGLATPPFGPIAVGAVLMGGLAWGQIRAYLLAQFAGAALAASVFPASVQGRDDS